MSSKESRSSRRRVAFSLSNSNQDSSNRPEFVPSERYDIRDMSERDDEQVSSETLFQLFDCDARFSLEDGTALLRS